MMTGRLSPSTGDIKAKKNTFSFDISRSQYWKCQAEFAFIFVMYVFKIVHMTKLRADSMLAALRYRIFSSCFLFKGCKTAFLPFVKFGCVIWFRTVS